MKSLLAQLRSHVSAALVSAYGEAAAGVDPQVKASTDAKFGDYQSNVAMSLAKSLGQKPRDVAQRIIDHLPAGALDMLDPPEIAGPGFINLRLNSRFLQAAADAIPGTADERLGIELV